VLVGYWGKVMAGRAVYYKRKKRYPKKKKKKKKQEENGGPCQRIKDPTN